MNISQTNLFFYTVKEAKNLIPMDPNGASDPYVKIKLFPDNGDQVGCDQILHKCHQIWSHKNIKSGHSKGEEREKENQGHQSRTESSLQRNSYYVSHVPILNH